MQELRRDVLKSVDEKIDQRLGSAVNEVKSMLEEARKSAAQAQAAVSKATAPGGPSVGGPALPKGSAAGTWSPWTPRTLEVKGLCDWAQRFSQGMSSEFAEEYLEKIKEVLGSNGDAIDWRKSVSANRYAYDFKVVIVMKELEDQGKRAAGPMLAQARGLSLGRSTTKRRLPSAGGFEEESDRGAPESATLTSRPLRTCTSHATCRTLGGAKRST